VGHPVRVRVRLGQPPNAQPAEGKCHFSGKTHIIPAKGETGDEVSQSQVFSLVGRTQENDAARFEEIDGPTGGCGFQFIVFQMSRADNELSLDGMYLKNVIIKDTRISYKSGALKLENVYFVNCTFDFKPALPARNLALAILNSSSITLAQSGDKTPQS
jgi:hypothetical protein